MGILYQLAMLVVHLFIIGRARSPLSFISPKENLKRSFKTIQRLFFFFFFLIYSLLFVIARNLC